MPHDRMGGCKFSIGFCSLSLNYLLLFNSTAPEIANNPISIGKLLDAPDTPDSWLNASTEEKRH